MINGENLSDNRGKHENHVLKLSDHLKNSIQEHVKLISHRVSHCRRESTSLFYFEQTDFTLKKLYELFVEYYLKKAEQNELPLKESTYSKYFDYHLNFMFNKLRTDVCLLQHMARLP